MLKYELLPKNLRLAVDLTVAAYYHGGATRAKYVFRGYVGSSTLGSLEARDLENIVMYRLLAMGYIDLNKLN